MTFLRRATLGLAAALLALPGCGSSSDSDGDGSQPSAGAPLRGSPLDAPLESKPEPAPELGAPDGGGSSYGEKAIQEVAAGLSGVDLSTVAALGDDLPAQDPLPVEGGVTRINWRSLSLEEHPMEDILDKLLYPEDYPGPEFDFPASVARFAGRKVSIVGYMIPLEWDGTKVPEFMLVGDLLGCCFGGQPQPDQWIEVKMSGEGADYFPYIPVVLTGTLRIEGIEDEAGYAAGCYRVDGESVVKDR